MPQALFIFNHFLYAYLLVCVKYGCHAMMVAFESIQRSCCLMLSHAGIILASLHEKMI